MSKKTIWVSPTERTPMTRSRVDCGLGLTMPSRCPMSRLRSVDFPAFGFPTMATIPARGDILWGLRWLSCGGARNEDGPHLAMPGCGPFTSGSRDPDRGAGDGLLSRALSSGVPWAL